MLQGLRLQNNHPTTLIYSHRVPSNRGWSWIHLNKPFKECVYFQSQEWNSVFSYKYCWIHNVHKQRKCKGYIFSVLGIVSVPILELAPKMLQRLYTYNMQWKEMPYFIFCDHDWIGIVEQTL